MMFSAKSFNAEEEANIQHVLTNDLCCQRMSSKGIDFQKQKFIHLANKIFKFNGWSYSVSKENIAAVRNKRWGRQMEENALCDDNKDGSYREDIGYGFYESILKGSAIQNARKLACADALIETLKGLGNAFNYLAIDDFNVSDKINSPSVEGDSSSNTQTDIEELNREFRIPPVHRKRGRKRRGRHLTAGRGRKMQNVNVPEEHKNTSENITPHSSHVEATPYRTRIPVATDSLLAYDDPRESHDVQQCSSSATRFQPTFAQDESTSDAPVEARDLFKEIRRIPARGRRGRKRRGRILSGNHWRRRRAPYITNEPETGEETILTQPPQVEATSDHPKVSADTASGELGRSLQNELQVEVDSTPQQKNDSPTSGSTNTADESPNDSSYVALVSADWRCETSACNSQPSNVEGVYGAIRTDSSAQSCALQLKRVNFAYHEERNPALMPPSLVISPNRVSYGVISPSVCKTEALDLSSSSATPSHFGYQLQNYGSLKKVMSDTNILQLF